MIRVLIVEEHPIYAEGLRALLETQSDLHVLDVVDRSADIPTLVKETHPHVVLLHIGLQDAQGLDLCETILEHCSSCRVVILSAENTEEAITSALAAGASGYILKTEEPDLMIAAVRAASRGEIVLHGALVNKVVHQLLENYRSTIPEYLKPLSERQRQVFYLAAQGYRNSEIAHQLMLSEETVKTHLRKIYSKLGLTNKSELRVYAVQSTRSKRD